MPVVRVPEELGGERVDKIVAAVTATSRAIARAMVDGGEVLAHGRILGAAERVEAGVELTVPDSPVAAVLAPVEVDFAVLHEDRHLLVVDKPAGLLTHPGSPASSSPSLAGGLLARHPAVEGVGTPGRWGIVHRLDRDTSGLLVVALTDEAHEELTEALRRREVRREYVALVEGTFDAPRGTIDAPIAPDPARANRRIVSPLGRPARTHYRRVEEWPGHRVSLLEVELETGRTHQIRVHLAAIDHPVVGDRWYGRPGRVDAPRIFLHAARLRFTHPVTGDQMDVRSVLPPDLSGVLDGLTADGGSGEGQGAVRQ